MSADWFICKRLLALSACVVCATVVGCNASADTVDTAPMNDPQTRPREDTNQPADRIAKVDKLGRSGDRSQMLAIIDALDDESLEVRRAAARAAKRLVGGAIPFRADGSPERRAREIDAYDRLSRRAEETNTEYLIDLVPVLLDDMESDEPDQRQQAARDVVLLTGVTYGFRGDESPEIRRAYVDRYRKLWSAWNAPGNTMLDLKRSP